jgi:microcystin-dependent protein
MPSGGIEIDFPNVEDRQPQRINDLLKRVADLELLVVAVAVPAGIVFSYVGTSAPAGYVFVDGSTITGGQTKFPNLWAVIPAAWKSGANIVLPDARGRAIIGAGTGAGLTARALAALLGAETVTLSSTESGVAAHSHTASSGNNSVDHTHSGSTGTVSADHGHFTNETDVVRNAGGGLFVQNTASGYNYFPLQLSTGGITANHTHAFTSGGASAAHTHAITVNNATGASAAAAHNNMQPSIALNWILKT